ncbi:MAG: hypothetical protein ACRERC_25960 [Candidatus Binatia bacterium]
MTMPVPNTAAPPPASASPSRRPIEEIVLVVLVLLSGIGVAINDYNPASAFRYWLWMTPLFGIISIVAAWSRARRRDEAVSRVLQTQVMHWVGVVGAVYLVYLLQSTGRMENEAAGLAALIVLALASFLAGVHGDWRLSLVGVVLAVTVVGFAILEQIIWVVVIPVFVIGVIALVVYMRTRA